MKFIFRIFFISFLLIASIGFAEPTEEDSCAGLLALVDRPSRQISVCALKPGEYMLEGGYQFQTLHPDSGNSSNFPQALLRVGLPFRSEININMPNYFLQQMDGFRNLSGFTTTELLLKHQFPISGKWTYGVNAQLALPSGSSNFGDRGTGGTLSGIVNYDITSSFSLTLMLGIGTQTTSFNEGGERFNSVNPDLVATWLIRDTLQFYVEIYGQSQTGPGEGSGYNADGGFQLLLNKNIEIDIEYGTRISGTLESLGHFVGCGAAVRF